MQIPTDVSAAYGCNGNTRSIILRREPHWKAVEGNVVRLFLRQRQVGIDGIYPLSHIQVEQDAANRDDPCHQSATALPLLTNLALAELRYLLQAKCASWRCLSVSGF